MVLWFLCRFDNVEPQTILFFCLFFFFWEKHFLHSSSIYQGYTFIIPTWNQPNAEMFVLYLSVCLSDCLSCVFLLVCHDILFCIFHSLGKRLTLLRSVHMHKSKTYCIRLYWCMVNNFISQWRNIHSVFSDGPTRRCMHLLLGSSKSLCIYFFLLLLFLQMSATQHRTSKTNQLFSPPQTTVLELKDQIDHLRFKQRLCLYILRVHFPIYRLHIVCFIFFLMWWQLCIPK